MGGEEKTNFFHLSLFKVNINQINWKKTLFLHLLEGGLRSKKSNFVVVVQ